MDFGSTLGEVIAQVHASDLAQESARYKADLAAERALALQRNTDPNVIIGTSALVARLAEQAEAKLVAEKGPVEEKKADAPEAPKETPNVRAHFPPPPKLGAKQ